MLWVRISIMGRCTTLWDTVCQWLATGQWFSPGTLVSSTNKTDHHDITYQQTFESQMFVYCCPPSNFISIPIKYIQKHKSGQKNILRWQEHSGKCKKLRSWIPHLIQISYFWPNGGSYYYVNNEKCYII